MRMLHFSYEKENAEAAEKILLFSGIALFVIFCIWNVYYLPMNMDEALIYHRLACSSHPFSFLHVFREDCLDAHRLTSAMGFGMDRPYAYVGPLQGLLYAPVYYAFNSVYAQYWFALPFLLLFVWLMARETDNPLRSWPLFLVCLPLVLKFIHDDGVLKIIAITFPLAAIAVRRMLNSEGAMHYLYALFLSAMVLLNIIDKVYFIYLLPAFVFFSLAFTGDEKWASLLAKLQKSAYTVVCMAVVLGLLLLVHLFSRTSTNEYYFLWLLDNAQEKKSFEELFKSFVAYTLYWPSYAHRSLSMSFSSGPVWFFETLAGAWFVLCAVVGFKSKEKIKTRLSLRTTMLLLSILSMVVVFLVFRNVWAAHHFMYLWMPGLMLIADMLARLRHQWLIGVVGGFFALNLMALIYMMESPISWAESRDRDAIFEYLSNSVPAEKSIVNFSSWGGYYIYSLYAPKNQVVTYMDLIKPEDGNKMLAISMATGRKIYNVCSGPWCNEVFIGQFFNNQLKFTNALPGLLVWRVYSGEPLYK